MENIFADDSDADVTSSGEEGEEEDEAMMIKPVFVPKSKRSTASTKEQQDLMQEVEEQQKRRLEEKRKELTRSQLAETLRRNEHTVHLENADNDSNFGMPSDASDYDDDVEYEAWKLRELKRLKRDIEEREADAFEKAELLRRRNMTDEERLAEDKLLGKQTAEEARQNKPKMKFLQKYYHKGAFYMDSDSVQKGEDVRARDYSAATQEDNINRETLPKILQVRNFGKKGRTKYTHLVDQDTTLSNMKRVDMRYDTSLMQSYLGKRGAAKDI